jgi:hypothetical protein
VLNLEYAVCKNYHPTAFQSLRGLLYLHFDMQRKLAQAYEEGDVQKLLQQVRDYLAPRIGEQLGGLFNPPPSA